MTPRVQAILLAVSDLSAATEFYAGLGFAKALGGSAFTAMEVGGAHLTLVPRATLTASLGTEPPQSTGAITLAHQVRDKGEVDQVLAAAEAAGATIVRAASDNEFLGYSGTFTDPDGHLWNVGYNPALFRA